MNYENIFHLQDMKFSFDQAKDIDARGIEFSDHDALREYQEEEEAKAERLQDLEDRGFYHGTDCQLQIDRIESQEAFDDRYAMFMNEY